MAEKKEKQYVSDNARLMEEWDWEKNEELGFDPHELTCGSGKKVWWKCSKGHEWNSRIADRCQNHGCPFCSGRKAISGVNDLFTLHPELIKEWDYEKNLNISPKKVKTNSHKSVWWKCKNEHIWKATIKNRINGHGCPYCSHNKAAPNENDLLTKYPNLAAEWHKEKNLLSAPEGISCYSNKKFWWIGICGHEWEDTPSHRVMGRGCPICNRQNKSSFPEQAIYYYILKQYPDAINGFTEIFPGAMELDVFIPSLNIGIEYDGKAWHNSKISLEREKKKFFICKEKGILLIRIKESQNNTDILTCDNVIYCKEDLDSTIKQLSNYFLFNTDINSDRDRKAILESYLAIRKNYSFASKFPNESREWHPIKNGVLIPSMFSCGSGENIWWICSKGHEWQMPIRERAQGNGCPFCSNHRLLLGYNDLQTVNPNLAKEWHPTKNIPLTPDSVLAKSTYCAWWKCKNGHEWQAKVRERLKGNGCPYCSNKKVLTGYNDLATTNPKLLDEWSYERNIEISPTMVTAGSSKKAWWKCNVCGHNWEAKIEDRNRGSGCPECAKEKRKNKERA